MPSDRPRAFRYGEAPRWEDMRPGDRYGVYGGGTYVVAACRLCGVHFSYEAGRRGRTPEYDTEECRELAARVSALDHAMTEWVRAQLRAPDGKARVGQLKRRLLRLVMSALNV